MTLTSSTATSLVSDCDTVIDVNVQWNNASVYHASVTDTSVLKSKAFTLLPLFCHRDTPLYRSNRISRSYRFRLQACKEYMKGKRDFVCYCILQTIT